MIDEYTFFLVQLYSCTAVVSFQTFLGKPTVRRSIFDIKIKFFIKTAIDLYLGGAVGCVTKARYQFDTDAHG